MRTKTMYQGKAKGSKPAPKNGATKPKSTALVRADEVKIRAPAEVLAITEHQIDQGLAQLAAVVSLENVEPAVALAAYHAIAKRWEKGIRDSKEYLRNGLLGFVAKAGVVSETPSAEGNEAPTKIATYEEGGLRGVVTFPIGRKADDREVEALLREAKIRLEEAMAKVVPEPYYITDMAKLKALVKAGRVPAAGFNALFKLGAPRLEVEKL